MFVGRPPFEGTDIETVYEHSKRREYDYPDHCLVSEEAQDLVRMLLKVKIDKRIKLEKILEHKFMTKNQVPT
jgi:serine/threonine protein kinase